MKISYKLLILFCLILFLIHLNYLFPDIMEARNFVTAREMVDDGNWIFTTINDVPRYQKPPLPTWLSAGMGILFGTDSLWALRFPAALSSVILVLIFHQFTLRETGSKKLSSLVALILSTVFLVLFIGKRAEWDIYSYNFGLIGIYFFYLTFRSHQKEFLNFTMAGIFLGLSFMSKGPTAWYVIGAPFFIAYWIVYGFPKIKWKGWVWMVVLALIIGLSWYGYIYMYDKENLVEILDVEANARTNHEVKSFDRYLSFPVQMGVWAIFSVVSLISPFVKKKTKHPKSYAFFFWWTILCLILLSLVPSKKERYLFPMMIPLAATTGIYLYTLIQSKDRKQWEIIVSKISFGLISLVGLSVPVLLFVFFKVNFGFYSFALSLFSVAIAVFILIQLFGEMNFKKLISANIIFVASAMIFGIPVIDEIFNANPNRHSFLTQKEMIEKSGLKLYGYNAYIPEMWFKYQALIPEIFPDKPNTFPKESEFYLVAMSNQSIVQTQEELSKLGYSAELIDEFDDNEVKENNKNFVTRKKLYFFKVFKNQN